MDMPLFVSGLSLSLLLSTPLLADDPVLADDLQQERLELSERTGYPLLAEPNADNCRYVARVESWLCPHEHDQYQATPESVENKDFSTGSLIGTVPVLLIPDNTLQTIAVFDAETGELIDARYIDYSVATTTSAVQALLSPRNTIVVSHQAASAEESFVTEFNLDGEYLGIFAPAGGADGDLIQNIRGIAFAEDGHLLVSSAAGGNANAIARFDHDGQYAGNFIDSGAGGLASPFDVQMRPGQDWLVSSINSNQILRYSRDGAFLDAFASISSFPQQIHITESNNVLVANFSGSQGIYEYQDNATLIGSYHNSNLGSYRGVFELPNGEFLVTNQNGVHRMNRLGQNLATEHAGNMRFITPVPVNQLGYSMRVNVTPEDGSVTCLDNKEVTIGLGQEVTFCYRWENNGELLWDRHRVVDSQLGVIVNDSTAVATPGTFSFSPRIRRPEFSYQAHSTWTAWIDGEARQSILSDSVVVNVVQPAIELKVGIARGNDPDGCGSDSNISAGLGMPVTLCYLVRNTALSPLQRHDLTSTTSGDLFSNFPFELEPGEEASFTEVVQVEGNLSIAATWTSRMTGDINATVSDSASAQITAVAPSIDLSLTLSQQAGECGTSNDLVVPPGSDVALCYTVTNTGLTTLTRHDLSDDLSGDLLESLTLALQPGESHSFLRQTSVQDNLSITADWTATADDPTLTASATASAQLRVGEGIFNDRFEG